MKPGRASRTAELVCVGRAVAHGRTPVARFNDPTAFALLPDESRQRVLRVRSDKPPKGLRARIERGYVNRQSQVMVARTVHIDDAIREADSPQVVILGAGLDGRAFRMPELKDSVVFEVDHPDSQRDKRARAGELKQAAKEVRFVPVDFERDQLDAALERAGHDPKLQTTWVWEGVVMYLTIADIEKTLAVIAARSAPKSRVIIVYHHPALILQLVGWVVALLSEPLRSRFTEEEMRALLLSHGFSVLRDLDIRAIGESLGPELARSTRVITHLRIVTGERRA